jgi:protein SCO1/2
MTFARTFVPVIALLAAMMLLSSCSGGGDDSVSVVQGESRYDGAVLAEPKEMPDAVLTDTSGQPYDLREQAKGKLTLLYVGYTHCPDICPAHMANIAAALKQLPPDVTKDITVVFVTSDPDRDTPEVLRDWLNSFNPNFVGLTSSQDNVDAVQRGLGLQVAVKQDLGNGDYSVSHAADVMAFTKDRQAHLEFPTGSTPDDLVHDLPLLVKGWKNP